MVVLSLFGPTGSAQTPPNNSGEIHLVINEFMANNTGSVKDPQGDYDDWIEIYNYGDDAIDIGGMYLTDNLSAPAGWMIPRNNPTTTTILPQGYLLIWADSETSEGTLHADFKLNAEGEQIGLSDTSGSSLIDSITFGPQTENSSYGRFPDGNNHFQIFNIPTPGQPNTDRSISVLINEIMYNPYQPGTRAEDTREEYIELFNHGSEEVNLSDWRFSDGVEFVFPDIKLDAGEYLVVAADENTFRAKYSGVNNVIGNWNGRLSNSGEKIELINNMGVMIDSVRYADEGDWGQRELGPRDHNHRGWIWLDEHDGGGKSLELINPELPNQYGQNWTASNSDGGSPGVLNSTSNNNIAPLIEGVTNLPIIPRSDDQVKVSAHFIDEQPTGITATLHYRIDTSIYRDEDIYPEFDYNSFNHVIMSDNETHGDIKAGDGIYTATIPAHHNEAVIEFYIEASDSSANRRTWPAPSIMDGTPQQVTNAFYQVDDSFVGDTFWIPGSQPIYYLIMTQADKDRLLDIGDKEGGEYNSNAEMNATFISVDGVDIKVRHNLGVRNRGHGSRDDPPNNYRLNFPHDRPWKGVTAVNLNTKYTYLQIAGSAVFRLSGLPEPEATAVQLRVNCENLGGNEYGMYDTYAHVEVIDSDFVGKHFPDDSAGNAYKCMRDLGPANLDYRGTDPDSYRNSYFKRTNISEDDWSDLIELCYVMSGETLDESYIEEVNRVINADQWLRALAINALLDNRETTLANGVGDDYYLYRGVEDPRFVLIQHDLDTIFGNLGSITSSIFRSMEVPSMDRLLSNPQFISRYYFHLRDLIETTFSAEKLRPLLDNLLSDFVPPETIDEMMDFMAARNSYVLSLIPSELSLETTLNQSSGYYKSYSNVFTLFGAADPVETRSVSVNNQSADWEPLDRMWYFGGGRTVTETLISTGSVWKYLDDGSNQGIPSDGTNWFANPNYNDSYWLEGPAELGYGDASQSRPEATVVYSGPGNDHFITTYFRHTFNVDDASIYSGLYLRLLRDDGAVVYLNGVEIARSNMPDGNIDYLTHANSAVSSNDESTFFDFTMGANLLHDGTNVLAVEIHQASGSSSDISFDLELGGVMPPYGTGSLWPGINRLVVQTFDGPNGMGKKLERKYIDIWYDDGDVSEISGTLTTDITLDAASGPWNVTEDLIVPAGITLEIKPRTTVFFDPNTKIEIHGRLIAEGTEYKQIRFTRTPGIEDRWKGLQFVDSMSDNRITYAVIEYGRTNNGMVGLENSKLLLDHVTLDNTDLRRIRSVDSSLIVRNCTFTDIFGPGQAPTTDNFSEHIWGSGISEGGQFVIENNTFGTTKGHNDAIDFDGPSRPDPIAEILNNKFMGGGDDALDLECDAHIEGNTFMNFINDQYNTTSGESNVISAGAGKYYVMVRNVFYNNQHVAQIKNDSFVTFVNNTVTNSLEGAIYFDLGLPDRSPGRGAYLDGDIFWNVASAFDGVIAPATELTVNNSIIPVEWHYLGTGNIDADPLFVDPNADFHLKDISPATETGSCSLDMGAYVPGGAAIYGEPDEITYRTNTTLTVGGPGITQYKYCLNNGLWSEERPVDVPINLTNLHNGQSYTVYVIGKNSAGRWQSEDNPTASRTWTIDTSYSMLIINEVLTSNLSFYHEGTLPDMIELFYDGPTSLNISGMSISNSPDNPRRFVFSSGTTISPGDYLVLYADSDTITSGIHLGLDFDDEGGSVYLYNHDGTLLDSVQFGRQLPDLSIGKMGYNRNWHLTVPTFGRDNISQPLGNPDTLKINEWFTNGDIRYENDFIELFNPHDFPVDLGGMYLTDNPVTQPDKSQINLLSFIDGGDFTVFTADDLNQPSHLDFKLSADGGMIGLFDAHLNNIDMVLYGPQMTDVSQGRIPDGTQNFEFFEQPNPGFTNHQP